MKKSPAGVFTSMPRFFQTLQATAPAAKSSSSRWMTLLYIIWIVETRQIEGRTPGEILGLPVRQISVAFGLNTPILAAMCHTDIQQFQIVLIKKCQEIGVIISIVDVGIDNRHSSIPSGQACWQKK
jgi:hypothetical protein